MEKRLKQCRSKSRNRNRCKNTVLLLFILMCLSVLPFPAFAASESAAASSPEVIVPVTVRVTGETPSPPEVYSVRLTSVDHAPLPDFDGNSSASAAADYLDLVLTGPGTVSFPPIAYPTVGVYRYTISQIAGNHPGAHYDAGVYTLTVTVTNPEEGSNLKSTVVLMKDGKKQDGAEFINDYGLNHNSGNNRPHPNTLIQTGQLNWPVWLLGCVGTALVALGGILTGRSRKSGQKQKDREA